MSELYGDKIMWKLSQYYSNEGGTPMLLATQNRHLDLVKYLFEELNSPLNQTGHFLWEEADYLEVPPLSGRPQAVK